MKSLIALLPALILTLITTKISLAQDVGIGISAPNELLHMHATSGSAFTRYSVNNSGTGTADGFVIGMDGALQAYIRQYENLPIFFYTNNTLRMRLTETGRLGVGVSAPAQTLDIGGAGTQYARVTSTNGATNGIEFVRQGAGQDWRWTNSSGFFDLYAVTNDFSSASTSDIVATFTSTGRFGIGTISPLTPLHVVGTIRNSDLAGTGTRPVVANSSGELQVSSAPVTKYWSANGFEFYSNSSVFNWGSIVYNTSGTGSIRASFQLPHGALVTSVYYNYGDISTISNIRIRVLKLNIPGNFIAAVMSEFTSSGTPGSSSPTATDLTIVEPVIDHFGHTYLIEVSPQPGTSWDFNKINLRNVRIGYTLPN